MEGNIAEQSLGQIIKPKRARILVMGIGGGGCNAIDDMISFGITSAEFVAVNTDTQALETSIAPVKIPIGVKTTQGLGAGAIPEKGKSAANESRDEIRNLLQGVDLLFITAGMGGGTGTGAAPVIAEIAKEKNILTIAVVTKPFDFEGPVRAKNAEEGIAALSPLVDTLIVIPNENLLDIPGNDEFVAAFKYANSMLRDAVRSIADVIAKPAKINLDFNDVKTIMQGKGMAHLSIGEAEGIDKVEKAMNSAIMSDLLGTNVAGATGIMLNIIGGPNLSLRDIRNASNRMRAIASKDCNIIFGAGIDETFDDKVQVTVVATGFTKPSKQAGIFGNNGGTAGGMMTNQELTEFLSKKNLLFTPNNQQRQQMTQPVGGFNPGQMNQIPQEPVQQPVKAPVYDSPFTQNRPMNNQTNNVQPQPSEQNRIPLKPWQSKMKNN